MNPPPNDPHWPRAGNWIAAQTAAPRARTLGLIGMPLCMASITPGRGDLAPAAIRAALARLSTYDIQSGHDLQEIAVRDFGDLDVSQLDPAAAAPVITQALRNIVDTVGASIVLGGNNSVTRPAFLAMAEAPRDCALITLDAHLDLRDVEAGLNNGNPVRALLRDGLPGSRIVQIGIQPFANSKYYADVAKEAGITVIPIAEVRARGIACVVEESLSRLATSCSSIYVDLDLDVLDRSFAPATPGSRPGGLTPPELHLAARLCGVHPAVRVIDLVELDPLLDVADTTVLNAAICLLSFAAGFCKRASG